MQFVHNQTFDRVEYEFNGTPLIRNCIFAVRLPMSLAYKFGFEEKSLFIESNQDVKEFLALARFQGDNVARYDKNVHLGHTKWLNVSYHPPYTADLSQNLKQLFIYCDIVEPQIIGSNQLKLLRVIPVTSRQPAHYDKYQALWEPQRVEYLKLSKKHFDTIEIQIRDALRDVYPFIRGRTVVKLHFKKAY